MWRVYWSFRFCSRQTNSKTLYLCIVRAVEKLTFLWTVPPPNVLWYVYLCAANQTTPEKRVWVRIGKERLFRGRPSSALYLSRRSVGRGTRSTQRRWTRLKRREKRRRDMAGGLLDPALWSICVKRRISGGAFVSQPSPDFGRVVGGIFGLFCKHPYARNWQGVKIAVRRRGKRTTVRVIFLCASFVQRIAYRLAWVGEVDQLLCVK